MRRFQKLLILAGLAGALSFNALSQGTTFTYQGRLNDGGAPANGTNYSMVFYLYDAPTNGNLLGNEGIVSVTVSNGLFTVPLDFSNVFDGTPRWLQVSVEKSSDSGFTVLWPRQQITPSPYAFFANTASNLSGTVSSSQLSGSIAATNISGTVALTQLPAGVLTNGATGVTVSGTFTGVSPTNWGYFAASPSPGAPFGSDLAFVTTADVNGDHKIDLICANTNGNTLTIMTNDGSGDFVIASSPTVGNRPNSVTAADINGDGKMDLICANSADGTLTVLTNDGSGNFVIASSPPAGSTPFSVTAADVNGDNKMDLICANEAGDTLTILTNNGNGGFTIASTPVVGNNPDSLVAADVNGDDKIDLISANQTDNTLSVLTNDGSGNFVLASSPASTPGLYPISVIAADVNNDGKMDLICGHIAGAALTVLTNNGSGGFVKSQSVSAAFPMLSVTAADINADGKMDLIGVGSSGVQIFTNNGSGGFVSAASLSGGNQVDCVTAADINGDGKMDLICAHASSDSRLNILTNGYSISASFMGNFSGNFNGGFTGDGTGLNLANTISYTPTIGDGTHNFTTTTAQGYYTKIGDLVFVEIWIDWNGLGSATNAASNVYISLPLASSSPRPEFTLGYVRGVAFADQLTASGEGGSTNLNLWSLSSGYAPNAVLIGGCAASGDIQLSGFYRP